jgi:hypothetical protein
VSTRAIDLRTSLLCAHTINSTMFRDKKSTGHVFSMEQYQKCPRTGAEGERKNKHGRGKNRKDHRLLEKKSRNRGDNPNVVRVGGMRWSLARFGKQIQESFERKAQATYILESLEGAPPVTLATRNCTSSIRKSSCETERERERERNIHVYTPILSRFKDNTK